MKANKSLIGYSLKNGINGLCTNDGYLYVVSRKSLPALLSKYPDMRPSAIYFMDMLMVLPLGDGYALSQSACEEWNKAATRFGPKLKEILPFGCPSLAWPAGVIDDSTLRSAVILRLNLPEEILNRLKERKSQLIDAGLRGGSFMLEMLKVYTDLCSELSPDRN